MITAAHISYIEHPSKVARTEQRRMTRSIKKPSSIWSQLSVSSATVKCAVVTHRMDNCQVWLQAPSNVYWMDGDAYINKTGTSFTLIWASSTSTKN